MVLHHSERALGDANDYKLVDNHRPPQPLYARKVFVSKKTVQIAAANGLQPSYLMTAMAVFLLSYFRTTTTG